MIHLNDVRHNRRERIRFLLLDTLIILALCAVSQSLEFSSNGRRLRQYNFNVNYFPGAPDGVNARKILGVNGEFPGPLIMGNRGDTIIIRVTNNMETRESLAMHWHGLFQHGTPFEDGAEFVTQCGIPYGQSQMYNFTFQQVGTYWWHSHAVHQYTEGLFGPIVIHPSDPIQDPHEVLLRTMYEPQNEILLILSDWNHATGQTISSWFLSSASEGNEPIPDSSLINGWGQYPCSVAVQKNLTCTTGAQNGQRHAPEFWVTRSKTYRFRIISAASFASFNFSIEDHKMRIMEADGCLVKPKRVGDDLVDVFTIAPGQRYSFLTTMCGGSRSMLPLKNRFLIRSRVLKELFPEGTNINQNPDALENETVAFLRYELGNLRQRQSRPLQYGPSVCPNSSSNLTTATPLAPILLPSIHDQVLGCSPTSVGGRGSRTVVLNESALEFRGGPAPTPTQNSGPILEYTVSLDKVLDDQGVNRLVFNGVTYNVHDGGKPLLALILANQTLPLAANPFVIPRLGQIVQIIVNNNDDGGHPLHLHGQNFWVVGKGVKEAGAFNSSQHQVNTHSVARDTTWIEEKSWLVIRWRNDNPGVHLFHCHMQWHAMSGLQMAVVAAPDAIRQTIHVPAEARRICGLNGIHI